MLLNLRALKILDQFASDYNKKIYGRDVAKKLEMNQKTVSNILNRLEKENILKFSEEGRNKYYYLNRFNKNIKEIMKLVEINRKINFLEKYRKIKDLFDKIEERTEGIGIIFGSYAEGLADKSSDLDILVLGKISDINDLEKIYNIKINVIKSNKDKFDKNEAIIKEVIKNHIVLRGIEEFINLIW